MLEPAAPSDDLAHSAPPPPADPTPSSVPLQRRPIVRFVWVSGKKAEAALVRRAEDASAEDEPARGILEDIERILSQRDKPLRHARAIHALAEQYSLPGLVV